MWKLTLLIKQLRKKNPVQTCILDTRQVRNKVWSTWVEIKFKLLGTFLILMDLTFINLLLCAGICVEICPVLFIDACCVQCLKCWWSSSVSAALFGDLPQQCSFYGLSVAEDLCCTRGFSLCIVVAEGCWGPQLIPKALELQMPLSGVTAALKGTWELVAFMWTELQGSHLADIFLHLHNVDSNSFLICWLQKI